MKLTVNLGEKSYDIIIEHNILKSAGKYFNLDRKVMVVTDDGVPAEYAETVKDVCRDGYICTIPGGEASKNIDMLQVILKAMLENNFSRRDCVVAVGGGVVGDMAGFAAAIYMRGIDFYNIPTTILSQVDSSIGGKVAIDFESLKNIVGAFHQPRGVLIDPETIKTLSPRQRANGLVEAVKTGIIGDKTLFEMFENDDIDEKTDEMIYRSLQVKRRVVEQDPTEKGIRKILNFGHTVGHGIEAAAEGKLLHGECVALGMMYVCSDDIKKRLLKIYEKLGLMENIGPYIENIGLIGKDKIMDAMRHDKKAADDMCSVILSDSIGSCNITERRLGEIFG